MAVALTTIDDYVANILGITIGASSTPSTTEVQQWLKDAQMLMLKRLPVELLGDKYDNSEVALDSTTTADFSSLDIVKLKSALVYDADGSPNYTNAKVVNLSDFTQISNLARDDEMFDHIVALDQSDGKIHVYPAMVQTNDKIYATYILNVDTTDTNYELSEATIPTAVQYVCHMAALQMEDMTNMAGKFLQNYELGIRALGGR